MALLPNETPAYWNRQSRRYDLSVQILNSQFDKLLFDVAEMVPAESSVLEAGCGTGLFTLAVSRNARRVVATDLSQSMVEITQLRLRKHGRENVEVLILDAMQIDFLEGPFDAVICANLLHLLPEPKGFIQKALGQLKPGGILIVPTFLHNENILSRGASFIVRLSGFPLLHSFDRKSYQQLFDASGTRVKVSKIYRGRIPIQLIVLERN